MTGSSLTAQLARVMVSIIIVPLYSCDLMKVAESSAASRYLDSFVASRRWADNLHACSSESTRLIKQDARHKSTSEAEVNMSSWVMCVWAHQIVAPFTSVLILLSTSFGHRILNLEFKENKGLLHRIPLLRCYLIDWLELDLSRLCEPDSLP